MLTDYFAPFEGENFVKLRPFIHYINNELKSNPVKEKTLISSFSLNLVTPPPP